MIMTLLKPNEVLNDLLGYQGMKIIQRPDMFNFSLDSTLLADFVVITKNINTIIDLGTGFAPVPLFLSQKTNAQIIGVEVQEAVADLAQRNVALNHLENQITVLHEDIKNLKKHFRPNSVDLITCNPPFFKYKQDSHLNLSDYKTIARHEKLIDLATILKMSRYLLSHKAHLYLVHRPERLSEIIALLKEQGFAIKRLRFVYPKINQPAINVLIDASNQGSEGMTILPPLIVHNEKGYTEEVLRIFNNERR